MGLLDRLMQGSVDRAARMQPKRVDRVVNEYRYAAPSARDEVAALAEAAARLDRRGFAPAGLAALAVRRSPGHATVTAVGCDLAAVDNRHLQSVPIAGPGSDRGPDPRADRPVLVGLSTGQPAAVWAYPPALLSLAQSGRAVQPVNDDLVSAAGTIQVCHSPADAVLTPGGGVYVIRRRGVLATGQSPMDVVHRLEAAEALARQHDHAEAPWPTTSETRTHG